MASSVIERVEVLPGEGTVIRYGGVVCWAAPTASAALISFLAQSARNLAESGRGGRQIADHIARVLSERDPEPQVAFAVVGPDSGGWASLLHGPVQAWDGNRWLAPTPSPGWLRDGVDPKPALTVNYAGSHVPALEPDGMWDLQGGVVRGGGFVLVPAGRGAGAAATTPPRRADAAGDGPPAAAPPEAPPHEATPPDSGPDPTGVLDVPDPTSVFPASPPTEAIAAVAGEPLGAAPDHEEVPPVAPRPPGSIDLTDAGALLGAGEDRTPLPTAAGPERPVPGAPVVAGCVCEHGHLNRPGMTSCARCGSTLARDVPYTVTGTRPGLGCLVVDDGAVWRLDAAYLVGSDPAEDPTVSGGMARPLPLAGDDVSPAHADIRLTDWDVQVIDRASPNGTWVYEPGASSWTRLAAYEARTLRPGTHISFGRRIVTYVTPWVVGDGSS